MAGYRISEYVEWRAVDDEVVLLDARSELYMSLNPTGAVLWKGFADGEEVANLVERLVDHFGVDAVRARSDAEAFIADLVTKGLVVSEAADDVPS